MRSESLDLQKDVITWRRHLHENAELSYQEYQTSDYIYRIVSTFPGVTVTRPTKTSVYAVLKGGKETTERTYTIAFRADIDALPIMEEADIEFKSKNPGVMHACGHDVHAAMLLGTVKALAEKQNELSGEFRFIFQHAEEVTPGGAIELVEKGVMEGVDYVFALHVYPYEEAGKFTMRAGAMNAAGDDFEIKIIGSGGHASTPELTVDPLIVGAEIATNISHVVARKLPILKAPVITVTKFNCGNSLNVIADTAELGGTIRSHDPEVRIQARDYLEQVVRGIAAAHGAEVEVKWDIGCAAVINDEKATAITKSVAEELVGPENVISLEEPLFGAEDFAAYSEAVPASMQFIGVHNASFGQAYPLHHPKFKVDEEAMQYGVSYFVKIAEKFSAGLR
ncbi:M20 family metallopeptidase [Sporosarcina sp. Te-1]|uniref:M20 metallopeptidase family protein n=1 Tax=Sporosarcina sp. Te-1 TaxID=2818390 RepID=UPI001A9DF53B|nr:amidohydrolase [Sporosarcina sp. Te-1]QTD40694.1 amidohydrolase [Sporosarcina sp. Te-1]